VVEARIGQGGMAAVWRVRDGDGRAWALKRLTVSKREVWERFRLEGQIQLALDHPHIVRARELVEADGEPALVMDLVEGLPLDAWQLANPDAPIAARDRIASQLVDALSFAHGQGLIHRDLKPSNVLVADRGGPWCLVTDFGLAKWVGVVASTRTGIALGTPRYMAPEQVRDAKRVDARADVWSLGVVLYELYTGQPAFHRGNLMEVFTAVVEARYEDPARYGVPERVRAAIRGALVVDPARRFATCGALLAALEPGGVDPAGNGTPSPSPGPMRAPFTPVTLAPPSDGGASSASGDEVAEVAAPPRARVSRAGRAARARGRARQPWVRTWIVAWSGAMILLVVGGVGGLVLLGGLATLRTLLRGL
jgi:eukaryotic-like serine/threonine-protein kinase